MTATLNDVAKKKEPAEQSAEQQAAVELVRLAKEQGLSLTGPDGLLRQLTKTVLETALSEEKPSTWAMRSTTPPTPGRATSATAHAVGPCSPKCRGMLRSRCLHRPASQAGNTKTLWSSTTLTR
jgi:hypothetical protein